MALLRIAYVIAVACSSAGGVFAAQAQELGRDLGWKRYSVQQTGTEVDFPAGLFPVDIGPPERGVGRVFESQDGRAKFSAYTLENEADDTPRSYLQKHLKVGPAAIDYRRVTGRFFVVSGVRDGEIYYSRCNFRGRMHCIFMSYPERELRAWDRIVTRVSLSLRGPR